MTLYRCLSCGGVYDPDQPGGYYHACPDKTVNPRDENLDDRIPDRPVRPRRPGKGWIEVAEAEVP